MTDSQCVYSKHIFRRAPAVAFFSKRASALSPRPSTALPGNPNFRKIRLPTAYLFSTKPTLSPHTLIYHMFHKSRIGALALSILSAIPVVSTHAENYYGLWAQEKSDEGLRQGGTAVGFDSRGNVIAAGYIEKPGGNNTYSGYVVKYDLLDGHILWEKTITAAGDTFPAWVTVDKDDNVIVACLENNADPDIYVNKYSPDGTQAAGFPQIYNNPNGGSDIPAKVLTDSDGSIYVTGRSKQAVGGQLDAITLKYAAAGGVPVWEDRYNFTNREDRFDDIAIDKDDNIITCGTSTDANGEANFLLHKVTKTKGAGFTKNLLKGGDYGASGVAVDGTGQIFVSGISTNVFGYRAIHTEKYSAAGDPQWANDTAAAGGDLNPPDESLAYLAIRGTSITVGPDGDPAVCGTLRDTDGAYYIRAVKYHSIGGGERWNKIDRGLREEDADDTFSDQTIVRRSVTDGSSNTIIVGESVKRHGASNNTDHKDIYIAKYNSESGDRVWFTSFDGSYSSSQDRGTALAIDRYGNIAATTVPSRDDPGHIGRSEMATIKLDRFIAETGDDFSSAVNAPVGAEYVIAGIPATNDLGSVAAKATVKVAKKKSDVIFTQGPGGGNTIAAIAKGDALGTNAQVLGQFASFSDPLLNNAGRIAFPAKITGVPGSQNEGVWTNLSGVLKVSLQKGVVPPGLTTEKLSTVLNFSLRNNSLVALVKVAGPGSTNTVLLNLNAANAGTILLRTGQDVMVNNLPATIKKLTVLSPAKASPADGRWHGDGNVLALATLSDKRTVVYRVNSAGMPTAMLYTDGLLDPNMVDGPKFKTFGLPAISSGGVRFAALATLNRVKNQVTSANDTALLFSTDGTAFSAFARADANTPIGGTQYKSFSDPLVNLRGALPTVAFVGTLKGTGVKGPNSKAIFFGLPGSVFSIARLGSEATDSAGALAGTGPVWGSFTSFILTDGTTGAPVFVAKLSGKGTSGKNNLGIWAFTSDGKVRRLIRTGDLLDGRTVKSFNLLKDVPKAFSAARSFNNTNAIVAEVNFTDKSTALIRLAIP
jgi:hypothetical protein